MIETLTINGTDMSSLVRNVESLAGLITTPQRRGDNIPVPGRHGQLSRSDRPFDAGTVVLPMWVVGADAATGDDLIGDASVLAYYARCDELIRLLHAPTLTIDHALPDGTVRRCVAEMSQSPLDFTRQLGHPLFGRVGVELTIPGAFWRDITPVTPVTFTTATGGANLMSAFAAATAPMVDLDVTFGPSNNPQLTQPGGGSFIAYDGVITSGQTLTIHCDDTVATPLVGTGGLVPDYTKLRYLPPRWFELNPSVDLTCVFTHTGGGTAQVTVAGRRAYLTG